MKKVEISWVREEDKGLLGKSLLVRVRIDNRQECYVRLKENSKGLKEKYDKVVNGEMAILRKAGVAGGKLEVNMVASGFSVVDVAKMEGYTLSENEVLKLINELEGGL